jgi:hypothetical protein
MNKLLIFFVVIFLFSCSQEVTSHKDVLKTSQLTKILKALKLPESTKHDTLLFIALVSDTDCIECINSLSSNLKELNVNNAFGRFYSLDNHRFVYQNTLDEIEVINDWVKIDEISIFNFILDEYGYSHGPFILKLVNQRIIEVYPVVY